MKFPKFSETGCGVMSVQPLADFANALGQKDRQVTASFPLWVLSMMAGFAPAVSGYKR